MQLTGEMMFVSSRGDREYAAPEVFNADRRDKLPPFKQDVYSLGLIACDMIAKELPTKFEVRDKQVKFFPQYSPAIVELIYSMLKIDPLTRPTIQNVLTDKLLASEV